jgi:hypothetical protein
MRVDFKGDKPRHSFGEGVWVDPTKTKQAIRKFKRVIFAPNCYLAGGNRAEEFIENISIYRIVQHVTVTIERLRISRMELM